ncbi:MAG TPA: hypothetical protein VJ927_02675 [Actinomycetota bacterium]|nr:hypothetical protein [Actinomycetota bacterium]
MKKRIALAVAAAAFTAVLASPATALAQETTTDTTVDVVEAEGITWVQASVPDGDHSEVQIKILRVKRGSDRLWQRCDFVFNGPAAYNCGFDSGEGSLAAARKGTWLTKVFVDGEQVSKTAFSL